MGPLQEAELGRVLRGEDVEGVGEAAGDRRRVLLLGPEAEGPPSVGVLFGVGPLVGDVGLEDVGALVVGDGHELLAGQLEEPGAEGREGLPGLVSGQGDVAEVEVGPALGVQPGRFVFRKK